MFAYRLFISALFFSHLLFCSQGDEKENNGCPGSSFFTKIRSLLSPKKSSTKESSTKESSTVFKDLVGQNSVTSLETSMQKSKQDDHEERDQFVAYYPFVRYSQGIWNPEENCMEESFGWRPFETGQWKIERIDPENNILTFERTPKLPIYHHPLEIEKKSIYVDPSDINAIYAWCDRCRDGERKPLRLYTKKYPENILLSENESDSRIYHIKK